MESEVETRDLESGSHEDDDVDTNGAEGGESDDAEEELEEIRRQMEDVASDSGQTPDIQKDEEGDSSDEV